MRGTLASVEGCPEPWALEAFAQGHLDDDARRSLEGHLDRCPDCAQTVAEVARLFGSDMGSLGPGDTTRPRHATSPASGPPPVVGRYRLGPRLGAGAMGMVFEAHDPELNRRVAVKLLHPGLAEDAEHTRTRLLLEAQAMARLAHPNVVAVHDVGRVGEQVFVAMELVEGTTLSQWLRTQQRSVSELLGVFVQAGQGLEAAHAVGLVHRDFKPDNVLIGVDGRARVTDFGLARPLRTWSPAEAPLPAATHDLHLTIEGLSAHGVIVGTPAYMAPEQWRGQSADARSDQFSFCVALFEALVSTRPFVGNDLFTLCDAVLCGRVAPMPRSLPGWLRGAVLRGLAVDPALRHPSMAALLGTLARDRGAAKRWGAIVGATAIGAAATVGVLTWIAEETVPLPESTQDASEPEDMSASVRAATVDAPEQTTQACRERARTHDGRWTAERRHGLESRLHAMQDGEALARRVMPRIDAWVETYVRELEKTCDPEREPVQVATRRRCLERASARFDALVGAIGELPSFRARSSVAGAVHHLPDPTGCDREPWLAAHTQPPTDQLGAIRLVERDLATAEALASLWALTEAPGVAEHAVERAVEIGHAPLVAEAQLVLGQIAARRDQTDVAVTALETAAMLAEAEDYEAVRGRASIELVVQRGARQLRFADAGRWQRIASAHAERMNDVHVTAEVLVADARLLHARLELRQAESLARSALEIHQEMLGEPHPRLGEVHLLLSAILYDLGDAEGASSHAGTACSMLRETVGEADVQLGPALVAHGRALLLAGELEAAAAAAEQASRLGSVASSLPHDLMRGDALTVLADVHRAAGDAGLALETYAKAAIYHYTGPHRAQPMLREGALLVQMGRHDEGLARLQGGLATLQQHYEADDPRLLHALRELGHAQQRTSRLDDARTTFTRALEIASAKLGYGPLQARASIDLAELERAAGNDARALALFDDAHVPWVGAYGMDHPAVLDELLARADLAWTLGQKEYAERLYRSTRRRLVELHGPDDPRTHRAIARGGDE